MKLHVSGYSAAGANIKDLMDKKMKVWIDIDKHGRFALEPPVALVQYERMELPKTNESTSTTTGTTATGAGTTAEQATPTEQPSTTPTTATEAPQATPVKVTDSLPLEFKIENLFPALSEEAKAHCKKEMAVYRTDLELQTQRANAKNDLEGTYYKVLDSLQSSQFTQWFKKAELAELNAALQAALPNIEEDRPEVAAADFKAAHDRILKGQEAPLGRRAEAEKRTSAIPEAQKTITEAINYANDLLNVHAPEDRPQTNTELEALLQDANELATELEGKLAAQEALPTSEDPAFKCAEIVSKAELLKLTMTFLKKKVMPKPPPPPAANQTTTTEETKPEEGKVEDPKQEEAEEQPKEGDAEPKEHSDL